MVLKSFSPSLKKVPILLLILSAYLTDTTKLSLTFDTWLLVQIINLY